MAGNEVPTPDMTAAAGTMDGFGQELDGVLSSLREKRTTFKQSWTGQAATAFDDAMTEWETEFGRIRSHMNTMASLLRGSAVEYDSAEDLAMANSKGITPPKSPFFKS